MKMTLWDVPYHLAQSNDCCAWQSGAISVSPHLGLRRWTDSMPTTHLLLTVLIACVAIAAAPRPIRGATVLNNGDVNNVSAATDDLEVRDGPGTPADTTTLNLL